MRIRFNQISKINNKTLLTIAAVGVLGIVGLLLTTPQPKLVATVSSHPSTLTGHVKSASTGDSADDGTTVVTTTTTTPAASSTNTSTQTSANGSILTAASTTTPSTPAPNPTPQPSYHITLRPDLAYSEQIPFDADIEQYVIPFDIVYDEGFVPTFTGTDMPGCQFLVTPTADSHVLCSVGQKESSTGLLVIQYDDTSVTGHYAVEAIYSINGAIQTDTVEFDLN